jgi:hypothetical protein
MTIIVHLSAIGFQLVVLRRGDAEEGETPVAPGSAAADGPTAAPDEATAAAARKKAMACTTSQQVQASLAAKLDAAPAGAPVQLFVAGHAASGVAYARGTELANLGAQGVAMATRLSGTGRLTTTGTIRRDGDGYAYAPEPRDRLVVPHPRGGTVDFTFHDVRGSSDGVEAFFNGDHTLSFTARREGEVDARFSSTRAGDRHTATARGRLTVDGTEYRIDLEYAGRSQAVVDGPGGEIRRTITTTGTVETDRARLRVDETSEMVGASADVRDGLGGRAHSTTRRIRSRLEVGDDTYLWNDVETRTSFRNGRASNVDGFWRAEGSITRNGQPYGSYRLRATDAEVQIRLHVPGDSTVLESYRR